MSDVAARWGSLINRKRKDAGLNQVDLGSLVGRPQSVISRWERGLLSPSLADQERLFSVLSITADDLAAIYTPEEAA